MRIGLLGASRIAPGAVIGPAGMVHGAVVQAVAASDEARAQAYAKEHDIAHVAADYAALIARDDVDLVYNALPPSGHARWSIGALEAGKHVLCEKPIALNAEDARSMVAAAERTGRRLIEAFHYRYHPLFDLVMQTVASGALGPLRRIDASFTVPIDDRPGELRRTLALGGGALMDLGCYPVHWCRTVAGTEPHVIEARARATTAQVDETMTAELDLGGVRATVHCSMALDCERGASLAIEGADGRLTVINPLAPHVGHRYLLETDGRERSGQVDGEATYVHQLRAVLAAVADGTPLPTEGGDTIANMAAIDAIYRAAGLEPRGSA